MRIGYGWDSHEFKRGITLKIGGMTLPHNKGLGGHSDGDVLLHALTDALLGAVGAPDIGTLFSQSDPNSPDSTSCRVRAASTSDLKIDREGSSSVERSGCHCTASTK